MALRFLRRLDGEARSFSYRTFSDSHYTRLRGLDPLEHAIHGSLNDCWQRLVALNRCGAAIAVTVNQTNGRGRGVEDICRIRALFLDDDRGVEPDVFSLPPHLRVKTSHGHNHYYWLVKGIGFPDYAVFQRLLARRFGGDSRVFALNQAMQLPGFWRRKRVTSPLLPELSELCEGPRYCRDQIRMLLDQKALA